MPSWPSRLLHTPQAPNASQSTEARRNQFIKEVSEFNASTSVPLQHGVRNRPSSNGSFRHGRSHSHPLTSIFSQTRKADNRHCNETDTHPNGSHHKPNTSRLDVTSSKASSVYPETSKLLAQDKQLILGRCATCDSMVKWPRHLRVFRCTICLMVNDLQSTENASRQQHLDDEHSGERKLPTLTCMSKAHDSF